MSDTHEDGHRGSRRGFGRKRKYEGYDTAKPPTDEENAQQTPRQQEDFSLYTPQQVGHATRNVRLDISFEDVIRVRDQARMIIEAMSHVVYVTKQRRRGSILLRIDARKEAAACARALNILNGKQKVR